MQHDRGADPTIRQCLTKLHPSRCRWPVAAGGGRWRLVSPLLKLTLTAGLIGFLFMRVDVLAVSRVLGRAEPALLAMAVAMLFVSYALGGLRWWYVVRGLGQTSSLHLLIGLFWVGGLMSQFLPNPLGDAVRVSVAAKHGVGLGLAIRSALFERLLMVLMLLLLIAATEPILRARVGHPATTRLAFLFLFAGLAGVFVLAIADWLLAPLARLPAVGVVRALSREFRRLLRSRWSLPVYATALLSHLNMVVSATIVGAAMALPLSATDYLVVMPVATVAMILPISIGGWGVREGVLIAVLGAMGVQAETALAFSLLYGLAIAASSLPALLFVWLGPKADPAPADP